MDLIHPILPIRISTILFLLLLTTESISSGSSYSSSSIYDILKSYGLPMGLFPKSVSEFSFDLASGRLELHLLSPVPCDAKFETRVRYEYNITGTLARGQIVDLSGMAAEELFLWLPVKGIRVDIPSSGLIYFDVGVLSKQLSLSFFETPKDCDVMETGDQGNGILLFDDEGKISENLSRKFVRKHLRGNVLTAVS